MIERMGFMDKLINNYASFWKNYVNFKDRTSKGGYWWAFLANLIVAFVVGIIDRFLSGGQGTPGTLAILFELAILLPGLAITVRRLRDAGRPWYHILIGLIPLVGDIILIVWLCGDTKSFEGEQVA